MFSPPLAHFRISAEPLESSSLSVWDAKEHTRVKGADKLRSLINNINTEGHTLLRADLVMHAQVPDGVRLWPSGRQTLPEGITTRPVVVAWPASTEQDYCKSIHI